MTDPRPASTPRRRRIPRLVAFGLGLLAVIGLCYGGWHHIGCGPRNEHWATPLEYPNRDDAARHDPSKFESAAVCGSCHIQHYAEWRESGMGRSSELSAFLIDLYQTSLDLRGAPAEDIAQCLHCHAPLAVMGEHPDLAIERALSQEAVSCDVCHTATAAYANDAPGMLQWDPDGPKRGPLPGSVDPEVPGVRRAVSPHHATQYSSLHESSELCGACHMSLWPTNALPIDWTYAEWKRSPYAERGVTCQACHMPTYRGVAAPGAPERERLHRHSFPGGGDVELVRGVATLDVSAVAHFAGHEVQVEVENVRAGHSFPTGNATAPVVKLVVEARADDGRVVFDDTREFKLTYGDKDGNVVNDPSAAHKLLSDTTLQPLEPRHERFFVAHLHGATSVRARLIYQRWNDNISGAHRADVLQEFVGRYLAQGIQLHRLPANLRQLDLDKLARVRNMAPTLVAEAELKLPPPPQDPTSADPSGR
ncbi:MAG: hypothetical protein B7733_07840 [Myxococcales bacterium FL481]|nr:MAG: hypothetical protein B7733_07840 [Myxococcales bacterium FL481]